MGGGGARLYAVIGDANAFWGIQRVRKCGRGMMAAVWCGSGSYEVPRECEWRPNSGDVDAPGACPGGCIGRQCLTRAQEEGKVGPLRASGDAAAAGGAHGREGTELRHAYLAGPARSRYTQQHCASLLCIGCDDGHSSPAPPCLLVAPLAAAAALLAAPLTSPTTLEARFLTAGRFRRQGRSRGAAACSEDKAQLRSGAPDACAFHASSANRSTPSLCASWSHLARLQLT